MSRAAPPDHCPICAAPLGADQAWCLECGAAARTRIAPTPARWRWLWLALAVASLLAILAIAIALAMVIRSDGNASLVAPATTTTR